MPLPNHSLTLSGACRCNSVLFEISIPSQKSRQTEKKSSHKLPLILPTSHPHHTTKTTSQILLAPLSELIISLPPTTPPLTAQTHTFLPLLQLPTDPKPTIPSKPARKWTSILPMLQDPSLRCSCLSIKTVDSKLGVSCSRCGTHLFVPFDDGMMELSMQTLVQEGLKEEWLIPERGLWWDGKTVLMKEMVVERDGDEGILKDYNEVMGEGMCGKVGA